MLGWHRRDDSNDVQGALVQRGRDPCDLACRLANSEQYGGYDVAICGAALVIAGARNR
jgi:hypothetical protein